jgi:hypothetical protein
MWNLSCVILAVKSAYFAAAKANDSACYGVGWALMYGQECRAGKLNKFYLVLRNAGWKGSSVAYTASRDVAQRQANPAWPRKQVMCGTVDREHWATARVLLHH